MLCCPVQSYLVRAYTSGNTCFNPLFLLLSGRINNNRSPTMSGLLNCISSWARMWYESIRDSGGCIDFFRGERSQERERRGGNTLHFYKPTAKNFNSKLVIRPALSRSPIKQQPPSPSTLSKPTPTAPKRPSSQQPYQKTYSASTSPQNTPLLPPHPPHPSGKPRCRSLPRARLRRRAQRLRCPSSFRNSGRPRRR